MKSPVQILILILASIPTLAAEQPNVVIIFIDDMGYGDIGPFGSTKHRTPNLDRMADEGMKLTSFYAAPVCSVSRAQLLTGCYGARISVPGVYFPGQANGLNPTEFTIAERLKELGYATMCVGKWHVGDQPEFLPTRQGFDHYFGIPYSNDMQIKSTETGQRVIPLLRDDVVAELLTEEEQSRIVERYTDEALKFIRANQNKPFLLYLPHTAVHTPIRPGEAFAGKSANGRYGDWVEEVDWSVGRVLDTLRETKLDERTLVVFTSDNGPWLIKGTDGGSAGPLRGGKGSTWEGGVREPTIAWWPGTVAPGSVCDAVAGTIDLLPTAVALAGGTVPEKPVIDGRDISPLLLGNTTQSPREAHYYFAGLNLQAVRQGPWKLAITTQREKTEPDGVNDASSIGLRLYNLDHEIGERTNVAGQHPDVVVHLQKLADQMIAEIGGKDPVARRPAGHVENPVVLYPSEENRRGKKSKNSEKSAAKPTADAKPARRDDLMVGATLAASVAPQVAGRSFSVSCQVETAQRDAIILAHGGLSAGYGLYVKDGRISFLVRTGNGASFSELISPLEISDKAKIIATLAEDATMSLQVDDQPAIHGKALKLIQRQPQEDFCLGHDNKKPVSDLSVTKAFVGKISDLKFVPTTKATKE